MTAQYGSRLTIRSATTLKSSVMKCLDDTISFHRLRGRRIKAGAVIPIFRRRMITFCSMRETETCGERQETFCLEVLSKNRGIEIRTMIPVALGFKETTALRKAGLRMHVCQSNYRLAAKLFRRKETTGGFPEKISSKHGRRAEFI